MRRYLAAAWPYIALGCLLPFLGLALSFWLVSAQTQARPSCPLPPGSFCTRVEDPGTGSYWICRERVR